MAGCRCRSSKETVGPLTDSQRGGKWGREKEGEEEEEEGAG